MNYEKCLVEVDEVLNHLIDEELNKIPEEIKIGIKEKKDKDYIWHYDETKKIYEQAISREAIAILSYLNMEYLLDEEKKALMEEIHRFNKKKKYNFDIKFQKNKITSLNTDIIQESKETQNINLMVPKQKKWYIKIFSTIKNIFSKH